MGHLTQRIDAWTATGAQHHLVYSYPLLDRRVLAFALGMPIENFRHGPWGRWFMRQALARVLPPEVCWHRDKTDPARGRHLRTVTDQALRAVGHSLASVPSLPARARYVDMPRIARDLKPQSMDVNDIPRGFLRHVLCFLDLSLCSEVVVKLL